jgi:protein tyrosine phosphatase (PTP) superfamily phosphohydrolase (DUF442 family)
MPFSPLAKVKPPRFIHGWIDAAEATAKHVAASAENVGAEAIGYAELAGFRYPVTAYQFRVTETLTRGSRLDAAGLADLAKRGFKGVVNLCKEYDDSASVRAAKLTPLHLPVLDNTAPPEQMMRAFLDFANDPKNQPTYVHCEAGKGRTGCAVACYRMAVQGWTADEAVADGKKFGLQLESQISWLTRKFYVDLHTGSIAPYPLVGGAPAPHGPWSLPGQGQWTQDAHGQKCDPVNLYAIGPFDKLEAALLKAGWTQAVDGTIGNNARYLGDAVEWVSVKAADAAAALMDRVPGVHVAALQVEKSDAQVIASMPVSRQTLDGKPFKVAYEFANNPVGGRHHIRVFATGPADANGRPVFAIAATQDVGIMFDPKRPEQGFMNHRVAQNTDVERDFLAKALQSGGAQAKAAGPIGYGEKNQYGYGPGDSKVIEALFS